MEFLGYSSGSVFMDKVGLCIIPFFNEKLVSFVKECDLPVIFQIISYYDNLEEMAHRALVEKNNSDNYDLIFCGYFELDIEEQMVFGTRILGIFIADLLQVGRGGCESVEYYFKIDELHEIIMQILADNKIDVSLRKSVFKRRS